MAQQSTQRPFVGPVAEEPEDPAGRVPAPTFQALNLTQDAPRVRVVLIPVSSIIGSVLDEKAEPLVGVSVQAIAIKASLSGTDYAAVQSVITDDRGRYSLLSLTPGDYLVRLAGEPSTTRSFTGTLNLNNDHRGMQPVYFPNTESSSSANVLALAPGSQTTADFRASTEPAFDITGRISGFLPQAWTRLQLYRDGDRIPIGRAYVHVTSGQFRLTDIPRGHYTLRVLHYRADPPTYFAAEQPITVNVEPVRDVTIQLSPGVEIPVAVSYEAGASEGQVSLELLPQHSSENVRSTMAGNPAKLKPSTLAFGRNSSPDEQPTLPQAFTDVIPDKYKLVANLFGAGYVASAKMGDVDALHGEFQISGPSELHVIVRGDSATVHGKVGFQGKPAPGANIYLIPTNGDGAGLKLGFADQEGHYEISGVAPGDYRVRAWSGVPLPKELMSGGGETLSVQAIEQRTLDLEAAPTENKSTVVAQ